MYIGSLTVNKWLRMKMDISISKADRFLPFSLVYLIVDNKILLLQRSSSKNIQPNKIMPPGGKVEAGESVYESALREFKEETGLSLNDMKLWGTFSWLDNNNSSGIFYIYKATKFSGNLLKISPEGKLFWKNKIKALKLDDLAKHQYHILPKIIDSNYNNTFNAFCIYDNGNIVKYMDSESYYQT